MALPSNVEAYHLGQVSQHELAVRQCHRSPDFLSRQNRSASQFVIRRRARLNQTQLARVAIENEEHPVGQEEAAKAERGFPLAGPDFLAVEAQASGEAALLL